MQEVVKHHTHTDISVTKRKHQYNPEYKTVNMIGEQLGYHFSEQREGSKTYYFQVEDFNGKHRHKLGNTNRF